MGNEVGGEEKIEMKMGSEHGGMNRLEGLESLALLNQRYASLSFQWFYKGFVDPSSLSAKKKKALAIDEYVIKTHALLLHER